MSDTELSDILRTIREVEVSLERRSARAEGTMLLIWGLGGFLIFAFYQLVTWNSDLYVAALGGFVNWVWIVPMIGAYVASTIIGSRLGRMGVDRDQRRRFRRGLIPASLSAALVTLLLLTGRYSFIYGGVVLVSAICWVIFSWPSPRGPVRTLGIAVGIATTLAGIALLAVGQADWAPGVAGVVFLLGFLLLGTVKYRLGR